VARYVNDDKLWVWKYVRNHTLYGLHEENEVLGDTSIEKADTGLSLVSDASLQMERRQVVSS